MSQSEPRSSDPQRPSKAHGRRYAQAFKHDAMRLVTHEHYSVLAAAAAVGVSDKTLRNWLSKARPAAEPCGENASVEQLKDENRRLRQQLKRAEIEREILKKATAYFASQDK